MSTISEVDGLKAINDTLSQIEDPAIRERILRWAWAKYAPEPLPEDLQKDPAIKRAEKKKKARKPRTKRLTRPKSSYTIDKNLNLMPKGKTSFKDFVKEKQPTTNQEKCVIAVYYLLNELGAPKVTANNVFT